MQDLQTTHIILYYKVDSKDQNYIGCLTYEDLVSFPFPKLVLELLTQIVYALRIVAWRIAR